MSGSLGGIDASIPLQATRGAAQQPNPLDQLGKISEIQLRQNANQLFPGQMELQRLGIRQKTLDLNSQIAQRGYAGLLPLLGSKNPITHDTFTTVLASLEHNLHLPTQGIIADIAQHAPQGDGPEFDAYVRNLIASRAQETGANAINVVTPQHGVTDVGGGLQPTVGPSIAQSGAGGATTTSTGGVVRKGPSPEFLANQIGRVVQGEEARQLGVPDGTRIDETMATRLWYQGQGGLGASPGFPGPGQGSVAGLPSSLRNPARAPDQAPAGGAPAPAPQPQDGGVGPGAAVVTQQSPAATAAQGVTGTTSANRFTALQDQSQKAVGQDAILADMANDAQSFVTGPGAESVKHWKQVLSAWGGRVGTTFGIDQDRLAKQESFDKLASQIADAQGAGSDARLAVNQSANPSSRNSNAGIDYIIRQLRGNNDYTKALAKLGDQWTALHGADNYAGFQTEIGSHLDPRVFKYMRMTPEQRQEYVTNMKGGFKEFRDNYNWAQQRGLVSGGQ